MKFAFKFKLPKWEKPKPEVPYVSNPMIDELEKLDFAALTAERRHDILLRIKHSTAAVAEDRRRNPAIMTDRIRLQRLWVDYFKIDQTTPPGQDEGDSLSFALSDHSLHQTPQQRAPGALMSTQEELVAQANFKIDMGDMVMDDMNDFDTPPPKLPPRPPIAAHDFNDKSIPVVEVKHPETGDSLKIAGLQDLVIDPPDASVAAMTAHAPPPPPAPVETAAAPVSENTDGLQVVVHSDEEPKLSADEQAAIVARMRALAQTEAAAAGAQTESPIAENPMVARMRALAAAKASEPQADAPASDAEAPVLIEMTADPADEDDMLPDSFDLVMPEEDTTAKADSDSSATSEPALPDEEPRLSAEDQIRITEDMRARIKAETLPDAAVPEDPMVARMRKLARRSQEEAEQEKPAQPQALTISIPDDPTDAPTEVPTVQEETFEQIKSKIVADTLQQAQSAQLDVQKAAPAASSAKPSAPMTATEEPALEAGMLDRLRRLAGLSAATKQAPEPALEPEAVKPPQAEPVSVVEPPPVVTDPEPVAAAPLPAEPEAVIPEPKKEEPKPAPLREREASATPSTRDWVNVKLLRPTVIRGLPLPDQVITIVPYPDAKRLEENGSVQILTKPRAPRNS
jgi:hypothetical protein